jgi:group II intron reverse transcriptase/maturase
MTALFHHLTVDCLREAYYALKRDAAPGVDGVTWEGYGQELEPRLHDLHRRVQRGTYRAHPVQRQYITKLDGRPRPLGIAALEDTIVQRAVVALLNQVYEAEFLGFSYGFRPRRGQHDALDALAVGITRTNVGWILDADLAGFYDSLNRDWLLRFLEHRLGDHRLLHFIRKWLKAGVREDDVIIEPESGVMQGAVISPLLRNVFVHDVRDLWAHQWRRRQARGTMIIVRYADDAIFGFQRQDDALRFWTALKARLAQFALALHPTKTRLLAFGRYVAAQRQRRGLGKPETFAFLGLRHICARTRNGRYKLRRHTDMKRMRVKLREIKDTLRWHRHKPIAEQGAWLQSVLRGYYAYYAVPTNGRPLAAFREQVKRLWLKSLRRRSDKHRMTWDRMLRLAARWLPQPRIVHPWPDARFDVKHPKEEPDGVKPHVRICTGGARQLAFLP